MLQDASFGPQSRDSFRTSEKTHVMHPIISIFLWNTRQRYGRSQGGTKYSHLSHILWSPRTCMDKMWREICFLGINLSFRLIYWSFSYKRNLKIWREKKIKFFTKSLTIFQRNVAFLAALPMNPTLLSNAQLSFQHFYLNWNTHCYLHIQCITYA